MNRSDRNPDAYDEIRDDVSVLGRTCGYCNFTGDMMAYAQHVCPRDVMQSEIDSLRAQLATVRSELAMVEAGAGVIEAQRDELQRALKAKTERFADMWRVATKAAFSNQDDRCCFCNARRSRLHEENCALNAWQQNAALAAAQEGTSNE